MIVPVEDLEAIVEGDLDDIVLATALSVGTTHAIQTRPGQRACCHVEIVERWPHTSGAWVHRFTVVPTPHTPHLLHKNPGAGRSDYTSVPALGMAGEGEAPSKDDMALLRQRARIEAMRDREERRTVQAGLPLEKRIVAYQHEAKIRRIDIRRETRLLRHMLERGRGHHAKQQVTRIEAKLDHDLDRAA